MLACLLIVFREVLEAGIVVGIVMAATQGLARRGWYIGGGIAAGVFGAGILALFAGAITQALEGFGQEIFNAAILIVAVFMLGWHNLWMASHGRELATQLRSAGNAVLRGEKSLWALAVVITVAVLREGSEIVLFLYGIAASTQTDPLTMLAGGVLGIATGAVLSWLLYRGLVAISLKRLFSITSWMIALLAAGMAGRAAAILAGIDLIPAWGYQLWDTSWLVSDGSLTGRALQAMVGYTDRPLGVQLAAWLATLMLLVMGNRLIHARPASSR
ncbi:iron permease [Pseudomonas sp. CCM 7893]|uniref:Iron permease n=1 Tax=Pseudomonas spelaei TaxID=1055469 RepID=A0A6I3WA42_9PSED|nr:FTR1 family protein [Pseudomonas spelaei]MUF04072.1 iron permease [Pseudomonas spelaei]